MVPQDAEPPVEEQENAEGVLDGVLGAPPSTDDEAEPDEQRTPDADRETGRHRPAGADDKRGRPSSNGRAEKTGTAKKTGAGRAKSGTRVTDREPTSKSRPAGKREQADGDRRPAGKRRSTGSARPEDLAVAETGTSVESRRDGRGAVARSKASRQISVSIVLAVVAVVLAGLAVFFRGQTNDLTSGDSNTAMTDMGATTQLKSQLTEAVNKTFSYNYTDLDSTAKAVEERLTGTALCEYNLLFGEVKKYAPEQKIILNTEVRDLGVVRIDGDRAEALVYIDQVSTRVDVNKTVSVRGQFAVQAHKDGDNWMITKFDMFGQPLFNGKPAPKC